MLFQREKKQLWRYASSNNPPAAGATISAPPPPPHRPPLHHPQLCACASTNSRSLLLNTPPPPYSATVSCYDGSVSTDAPPHWTRQQSLTHEVSMETTCTDSEAIDCNTGGCCCASYGGSIVVDDSELSNGSSSSTTKKKSQRLRRPAVMMSTPPASPPPPPNSFALSAANVFRNCCGGSCLSIDSSSGLSSPVNNNATPTPMRYPHPHQRLTTNAAQSTNSNAITTKEYFSRLLKRMKAPQVTTLLQAIKSVREPHTGASAATSGQQTNCILLKRGPILGEEPYVLACRIFLWNDLRSAAELKRVPICANARDPVYICCNPLHWARILVPEIAPPPYQPSATNRLRNEDEFLQNGGNSCTASMHSNGSTSGTSLLKSGLRVQIPESFTTDGDDRRPRPLEWCQVAYWELSQRVGERYMAEKSLINIYAEGPRTGSTSAGMCLKDLADKKATPSPESVQSTRQKIGLGVTLSQEADAVWLYNRSTAPIFLHSPTLNECWFHVCKVMPGYCVKAFDNHRAREPTQVCPPQIAGAQTGPVDRFSMRISFAKGWGSKYRRQDITACPCWLEVLFTTR